MSTSAMAGSHEPGDAQPAGLAVAGGEEGRRRLGRPERVAGRTARPSRRGGPPRRAPSAPAVRWWPGRPGRRTSARRRSGPRVGLSPTIPQQLAGIRIEPPPSEPCATGTSPAETAAPAPPLEPPAIRDVSHGVTAGRSALGLGVAGRAELRGAGLAEADHPRSGDPAHDLVVELRDEVREHRRPEAGPHAGGRVQVLDGRRHAGQRTVPAEPVRLTAPGLGRDRDERAERRGVAARSGPGSAPPGPPSTSPPRGSPHPARARSGRGVPCVIPGRLLTVVVVATISALNLAAAGLILLSACGRTDAATRAARARPHLPARRRRPSRPARRRPGEPHRPSGPTRAGSSSSRTGPATPRPGTPEPGA